MAAEPPDTPARAQFGYYDAQIPQFAQPGPSVPPSMPYAPYDAVTDETGFLSEYSHYCPTCGTPIRPEPPTVDPVVEPVPDQENRSQTRSYKRRPELLERVYGIMAAIGSADLTIGDFLVHIFTKDFFSVNAAAALGLKDAYSYSQKIGAFLRGRSTNRVSTVLELWLKHPKGLPQQNSEERGLMFSLQTPWKDLAHARPVLTSWAAQACRSELERETLRVIEPGYGLRASIHTPKPRAGTEPQTQSVDHAHANAGRSERTLLRWSDLGETTLRQARDVFEEVTPLLWGFLKQVSQKKRSATAKDGPEQRPWHIVATGALGQLLYCRRRTVNVLPLQRSLTFFAARASTVIYRIESRFGNTTTYSTLLDGLRTTGNERIAEAAALTRSLVRWYKFVFDNSQRYNRQHEIRAGRESAMIKGAAGTLFEMIGFLPKAWDIQDKLRLIDLGLRYLVNTDDLLALLDRAHVFTVRPLHWLQVLVDHMPDLEGLRTPVARLFDELAARESSAPPLHKTNVYSLRCNASDLSFTKGISDAIDDFHATQLGQTKEVWEQNPRLVIVGGDGATFEGILRLKRQRQNHNNQFDRYDWAEEELALWHTRWTELNRSTEAHCGPASNCDDPSTLRASLTVINRPVPSDLRKVEFQPTLDSLMLIGHARMLDCWRVILETYDLAKYFSEKKQAGKLPSLEELLLIATRLDLTYSSVRAHECAVKLREKQPTAHRAPENEEFVRLNTNKEVNEPADFGGDRVLANAIAFLYDFVTLREWTHATAAGATGRVYEVLKSVLFNFAGSGHNPKYFGYVLETILSLEYECSKELKDARLQNWLVNPSGLPGHYVECDLAQEHYIKPLTMYSQRANAAYDGDFERNVLSPNLDNLVQLTRRMEAAVELSKRSQKHTSMHTRPETRKLLEFYVEHDLHRFHLGRSYGYTAPLHFTAGVKQMPQKLKKYLQRHQVESDVFRRRSRHSSSPTSEAEIAQAAAAGPASETFDEGASIPEDNDAEIDETSGITCLQDGALTLLELAPVAEAEGEWEDMFGTREGQDDQVEDLEGDDDALMADELWTAD